MARQDGIFPVLGTIGNVTFLKTKEGYEVRRKGGVDAAKIASDPKFKRTRENGAEFGRAGSAGKLIRQSFTGLLLHPDIRMVARLVKELMRVIKSDEVNERGHRNVADGKLELLEGFEFNSTGIFSTTFQAKYTATIDRDAGSMTLDIAEFIPTKFVFVPKGCTHFKIISAGVEIDFEKKNYVADTKATEVIAWDGNVMGPVSLRNSVNPKSSLPLFLAAGIEFYQHVNGKLYPMENGAYNALTLLKVRGR